MTLPEQQHTVLCVDDDPELLQLLVDSLENLGRFKVVQATDGEQGLERFFEVQPACVIIDVVMPNLDGYQLVQALRGDPLSEGTPLIILTALAQDKDRLSSFAVGADQYLVKPVTPRVLVDAVKRAIAMSGEERSTRMQRLAEEND